MLSLLLPAVTGPLGSGNRVSGAGYRLDGMDLVRMCGPVSTSSSVMALDGVAQFLNTSNSI